MNTVQQNIENVLEENYMPYAMETIINRALPSLYDGFKPAHRKLLYTMHLMKLADSKIKSANITGQTLKLNPHGDSAVYETMVRMVDKNESLLLPYIDGKGNFGKVYSDSAFAHQRYTEAGLMPIAGELFKDINKDIVEFVDNYDETMKEPTLLPVTFPTILCNVTQGVAVGMASSICSFNLVDVCSATIEYLQTDSTKDIRLIPDFSTGGQYLYDKSTISDINKHGKGSITLRAKYSVDTKGNCIEITEIPYTTTAEQIIDKIADLIKKKKAPEINDVRDETDKNGLRISIDIKRNTNADNLMLRLFKLTPLQDNFSCNFNLLRVNDEGVIEPKVLGVHQIIKDWCKWRIECIRRKSKYDIVNIEKELHKLAGLQIIIDDLDNVIMIIRTSESDKAIIETLKAEYSLDDTQAEYIANMRLRNLNKVYLNKQLSDIEDLNNNVSDLQTIIDNDDRVKEIIIKELEVIKNKYGITRKTEIIKEYEDTKTINTKVVENYNCFVVATKQGYIKKLQKSVDITTTKIKDDDTICLSQSAENSSVLLVFTDKCNCYKVYLSDIELVSSSNIGVYLPTLLKLKNEEIVSIQVCDSKYHGVLINIYNNSTISKVSLSGFKTKNKQTKLKNSLHKEKLIYQQVLLDDTHLICYTQKGKVLIVDTRDIATKTSKNTQGVALMNVKEDDSLIKIIDVVNAEQYQFEDAEYYKGKRGGVGKLLKKGDTINV